MKTFKPLMAGFCLVVKYYGCNPSKMLWAIFLSSGIMQSIRICSVPVYRYTGIHLLNVLILLHVSHMMEETVIQLAMSEDGFGDTLKLFNGAYS